MKPKIEICCGSAQDGQAAQRGGADRIELNSALALGGLTPTLANLIEAKQDRDIADHHHGSQPGRGLLYDRRGI